MLTDLILSFRPTNAEQNDVLQQWMVEYPNRWRDVGIGTGGPAVRTPVGTNFLDWLQQGARAAVGFGRPANTDASQDYSRLFPHEWATVQAPVNAFSGGYLYGLPATANLMMRQIVAAAKPSPGPQSGNVTAGGTRAWWPYGVNNLGKTFY